MRFKHGYRQTEIGVIPEDWSVVRINDVANGITVGFVGSMAHLFINNGVPLLRGQNVLPNKLDLSETKYVSIKTHNLWKKSALRPGDIVMVRVGYPGTSCVIPKDIGQANAASLVIVRPSVDKVIPDFLSRFINSENGKKQIDSFLVGGAQQVLNTNTAALLKIPLPKIAEQEAIVESLRDIDALIESLEHIIAKKCQIKQGAMQELLAGRRRIVISSSGGRDKKTEFGPIPEDWEVKQIGNISTVKGRIGWRGYTINDLRDYGPLVIGGTHITSNHKLDLTKPVYLSQEKFLESPDIKIRLGDIILVKTGNTIGKTAIIDNDIGEACVNPNTVIIRPYGCDNMFLYQVMINSQFQRTLWDSVEVGAQPSVNQSKLKAIRIALPSTISEQKAIGSILSDMDTEITTLESKLAKIRQLKQGMMQNLLTGRIRLT